MEGEEIVGEELEQLNNALAAGMEEVTRLQAEVSTRHEAAHQVHHDRGDIHERVSSQLLANLGHTTEDMRIRDKRLGEEPFKTPNEFAAYMVKTPNEHQETRAEVLHIRKQRQVNGQEWGKYMAQAKERDSLLTKQLAKMAAELRKAQITRTETVGTTVGESLIEERLHTVPSTGEEDGDGREPPGPPNVGGAPNP